MANPIPNRLSLAELSRSYAVFEPDQVLTYDQLNSVSDYLNDQGRLTRVELLGVGIVGGLRVSLAGGKVIVSKGVGVTTDGDLLGLPADTVFASFRPYDKSAPRYAPLYVGDDMRTTYELVREGESGQNARPLSQFPGKLGEMVVVMLMESYQDDPDLCSGTDCDNLGKTAIDTARLLLVSRADAQPLLAAQATIGGAAQRLPELHAARPSIGSAIATTSALAAAYRTACENTHNTLTSQLGTLHAHVPLLTSELFGGDPSPAWKSRLGEHRSKASGDLGIQYYYDFLKDVVDGWNELREALLSDDSLLCPDPAAFPKHLLLGDLGAPAQSRTAMYPSPLVSGNRSERDRARFLARRLQALIENFALPATATGEQAVRVTPSRTEAAGLDERAIPYYYAPAIQQQWSFRLSRRGEAASILGYHTSNQSVFNRQIGRHDFFRVEGHLGQDVKTVIAALEKAIAAFNLPFTLRTVLLHNDRKKIAIRPTIRFTDLHRIHAVVRKELTLQLDEVKRFNASFKSEIDKAVSSGKVPDQNVSNTAATRHGEIVTGVEAAVPTLAQDSYRAYESAIQIKDWREPLKNVVNAAGSFKGTLGEIVRTDYSTAFDALVANNHPAWLAWLDALIQAKDQQEDDKLLFPQFCRQHPALEHFGGVTRGGTFILIYDDKARVVADCMLPYTWPETAESEPYEPELKLPAFRPPQLIDNGFKLLPPLERLIDVKLEHFQTRFEPRMMERIDIQKDSMRFMTDILNVVAGGSSIKTGDIRTQYQDRMLEFYMHDLQYSQQQLELVRNIAADPGRPEAVRNQAQEQIVRTEKELAEAITRTSTYIVAEQIDVAPGSDGGKALGVIAAGVGRVTDPGATTILHGALKQVQDLGAGAQAQVMEISRVLKGSWG